MISNKDCLKYMDSVGKQKTAATNTNDYSPVTELKSGPFSVVIPQDRSLKSDKKTLSPQIFTKRKLKTKSMSKSNCNLIVLENMLSAVVQAYYKSDYDMCAAVKIIKNLSLDNDAKQGALPSGITRRAHKRQGISDINNQLEEEYYKPDPKESNEYVDALNLLDYLISPLKFDYEFGELTRKLVA